MQNYHIMREVTGYIATFVFGGFAILQIIGIVLSVEQYHPQLSRRVRCQTDTINPSIICNCILLANVRGNWSSSNIHFFTFLSLKGHPTILATKTYSDRRSIKMAVNNVSIVN